MRYKFKVGDKVWFDGEAWEIVNAGIGPSALWRDPHVYVQEDRGRGRSLDP